MGHSSEESRSVAQARYSAGYLRSSILATFIFVARFGLRAEMLSAPNNDLRVRLYTE